MGKESFEIPLPQREDCPWWESASRVYALVIFMVFPLILSPETYINITATKFYSFVVLTCIYLAACLLIGILFPPGKRRKQMQRSLPLQRPTVPQIVLAAYLVWAVICTLASPYEDLWLGQNRFEGLCSLLLYGLVFLLLSFWGEYTSWYLSALSAMAVVMGGIALVQSFGSTVLFPEGYHYWNTVFLSTIGHHDVMAGYICILIPVLLCGFVVLGGRWRGLCLPGLFLMSYLAVFTDVDTAKMSFVPVIALLPFLFQDRQRLQRLLIGLSPVLMGVAVAGAFPGWGADRPFAPGIKTVVLILGAAALCAAGLFMGCQKRSWRVSPVIIRRVGYGVIAALGLTAVLFVFHYNGDNRLLHETSEVLHGSLPDDFGNYRGYIWKNSIELIGQSPVMGSGQGSFTARFQPYDEEYDAISHYGNLVDFAHNDFLNIGVSTGLVGMGLYICFIIALIVRCARRLNYCPQLLIFFGGILGYLVYSFFVFSIAIVSPLFWVTAGLADKCIRQTSEYLRKQEKSNNS